MKMVTISTRVPQETAIKAGQLGYQLSDILLIGLEIFMNLPEEEKQSLILRQLALKKQKRAIARFTISNGS